MGFWIFMLVMDLLLPAIMVVFGLRFLKSPPKEINTLYGYRTTRSMKNRDTWDFAHRHIGKLWRALGLAMLPLSALAMLPAWGKDIGTVALFGGVVCIVQTAVLLGSIVPTEWALKKTFDDLGNRR